jgi:hypothetical protein
MHKYAKAGLGFAGGTLGTMLGALIIRAIQEAKRKDVIDAVLVAKHNAAIAAAAQQQAAVPGTVPSTPSALDLQKVNAEVDQFNDLSRSFAVDILLPGVLGGLSVGGTVLLVAD